MLIHDADPAAQSQIHTYQPRVRPTWQVGSNEDLCALADRLFKDARLGWLIADLNQLNTTEMFEGSKRIVRLCVRQRIALPVWQDIVKFHKLRKFHSTDLVTVVTKAVL